MNLGQLSNTSYPQQNTQPQMSFDAIRALMQREQEATDLFIKEALKSDISLISDISQHIIYSGGKRLRPLLVLLGAAAFNYTGEFHIELAAVIELIHTATLLHDDVVDGSELRRGRPTANVIWGNQASVLVGDFLYSRAFRMMVHVNNMKVMSVLANATNIIAAGEVLQLGYCKNPDTTEEQYMEVIRCKTGALFEAGSQLGAILCDRHNAEIDNMAKFGMHLGTAFQLLDDALDYNSSSDQIGKNIGDDLIEGKPTLPLIYALRNGNKSQKELLQMAIIQGGYEDIKQILTIIEDTQAIIYTHQVAQKEAEKAITHLNSIPDSIYRNALYGLADFVIKRSF